ncbi:MAG: hypothetical protein ABI718_02740 [Acidobacteriota bacterium]
MARICPYCGADPRTGRKEDTSAILETHFPKRQTLTTRERLLDFVRMRQALALTVVAIIFFGLLMAVHSVITRRNESVSSQAPAIPLTEIADLSNDSKLQQDVPMPPLEFAYDGKARNMRTLLMEPGAVVPVPSPDPSATPLPSPTPASVRPPAAPRPESLTPGSPAPAATP